MSYQSTASRMLAWCVSGRTGYILEKLGFDECTVDLALQDALKVKLNIE